tara:strand:+ start:356 stop:1213 length:858 start_codon:yes stop_codon:yes gene_type:complete
MTLKQLKKKAKETRGEVIKRDDGNYKLLHRTIIDTSKWTLPEEILAIKNSIDNNTKEVTIHGIVRRKKDIPKCISKHCSFDATKAFKRWIAEMHREIIRNGYKLRVLEAQKDLPRDTKYKKAKSVTYVSGLKCYICNKSCLQAWTTWKKGRKATCSRKCMDRGMFHDMQHHHDNKWWNKYSDNNLKGYKERSRKDPETGKRVRRKRHQDNFEKHYGRDAKKGHHLHHINMCKIDDDVSNLDELTARNHQLIHATYNILCKPLMEQGIIKYKNSKGYYLTEKGLIC